jgi:hypothetical protein
LSAARVRSISIVLGLSAGALLDAKDEPLRAWNEYRTILWVGDSIWKQPAKLPLFLDRLREMGVNTAMVYGGGDPKPFAERGFPYYVENIVNKGLCLKWHSGVSDWDRFVTAWHKTRDDAALVREYCLDDPAWREWARGEMRDAAKRNRANDPVAYDLRDELSVTISANPFDYDFSPRSLEGFRDWLKTQYKSLEALNAEWETRFASWSDVAPFTTDRIKNRMASGEALPRGKPDWQAVQKLRFEPEAARRSATRWNFSPWADFRTYMDIALARTLDDLRRVAHEIDPKTPVGIEGTQMPHAFGGYDLARLSRVLDWIEPYDIGCSRAILGSFMPGKPIVTTVFEGDAEHAFRRLWHLLLLGDRGCVVWWSEDVIDWKSPDLALTKKARALAPVLREMAGPLARIFLRAEREVDPIAIHYSQASIQADWLIESCEDGSTWLRRFSSYESERNRQARARNAFLKAFEDLGWSPRFLSADDIEAGKLADVRVLVLPTSLALSRAEVDAARGFLAKGGAERTVICDGSPGLFDEHGKLRERGALDDVFPPAAPWARAYAARSGSSKPAVSKEGDVAAYARQRLENSPDPTWADWIAGQTPQLTREVTITGATASRTRVHRFRAGSARLLAFERNADYHMSEDLKQAGGNQRLEVPIEVEAVLSRAAHAYDLRESKSLGKVDRLSFRLDPWKPSLFALLDEPLPADRVLDRLSAEAEKKSQ